MPYFPLVERIQIAFATPGLSEDYLRFLVDPAGYMFAAAGDNLGEVILIAGGGAPPDEGEEGAPPNAPDNPDDRWDFHRPDTKQPEPPAAEDIHGVSDKDSWQAVRVYGHQQPFTVGVVFGSFFSTEHIAPLAKRKSFWQRSRTLSQCTDGQTGHFEGTGLLKRELKPPLYVRKFGSSSIAKNRNFIGCLLRTRLSIKNSDAETMV